MAERGVIMAFVDVEYGSGGGGAISIETVLNTTNLNGGTGLTYNIGEMEEFLVIFSFNNNVNSPYQEIYWYKNGQFTNLAHQIGLGYTINSYSNGILNISITPTGYVTTITVLKLLVD